MKHRSGQTSLLLVTPGICCCELVQEEKIGYDKSEVMGRQAGRWGWSSGKMHVWIFLKPVRMNTEADGKWLVELG